MSKPPVPTFSNPFAFDMLMLECVHEMMHVGIRIDQKEKKRLQLDAIARRKEDQEKPDLVVGRLLNVESQYLVPYYL